MTCLLGSTLTPSLLGVLLQFQEHTIAISGDIQAMFHQVRLLPSDTTLLSLIGRDMKYDTEPQVYEL